MARSEAGNNVVNVHAGQQVIADYARGAAAAAPSFPLRLRLLRRRAALAARRHGDHAPDQRHRGALLSPQPAVLDCRLSDAAGTLVERYAYTAYGELTILAPDRTARATSSFEKPLHLHRTRMDPTLRLYYFRRPLARTKSRKIHRRDPLGMSMAWGSMGRIGGLVISTHQDYRQERSMNYM